MLVGRGGATFGMTGLEAILLGENEEVWWMAIQVRDWRIEWLDWA